MYASQRARVASQEINDIAQNDAISLDSLVARPNREVFIISQVHANDELRFILAVTNDDAAAAQRPLKALADDWLQAIQDGIAQYRTDHSMERRIFGITATAIATVVLIMLLWLINRLTAVARRYVDTWQQQAEPLEFQNLVILTVRDEGMLLHHLMTLLRWSLMGASLFAYSLVISFFFPQTDQLGRGILNYFQLQLAAIWAMVVNFLPNLIVIVVSIIIAHFIWRANKLIFQALETGRITWPGFYPDWARPTRHLVGLLILAVTITIIFPYLPGSHSPAVQGLGLLVGALLTVGGASTVASLISGYVIIFSRAFQEGDLVAFDDYKGFVEQKSVLATQLQIV